MNSELSDVPNAALPQDAPLGLNREPEAETPPLEVAVPAEPPRPGGHTIVRGSATRCLNGELHFDLTREGSNLLELTLRQSRCLTPFSISSQATQVLFSRF